MSAHEIGYREFSQTLKMLWRSNRWFIASPLASNSTPITSVFLLLSLRLVIGPVIASPSLAAQVTLHANFSSSVANLRGSYSDSWRNITISLTIPLCGLRRVIAPLQQSHSQR